MPFTPHQFSKGQEPRTLGAVRTNVTGFKTLGAAPTLQVSKELPGISGTLHCTPQSASVEPSVPHPINCPGPQPGLLSAPDSKNGTKCKEKHLHVGPVAGDFTHLKTNNDETSDLPQCPAKSSRSTSNSWKTSHCFRNSEYLSPSDSSSVRPNQSELRHCCGHSLNFCSEALRNRKNNGPGGVALSY